jgi:raffinose/stachyose/melibiose transport system substrate-binding protein
MASQDWIKDVEQNTIAKNFEKETGIKIDFQIAPADQYLNLLATKLNSGECTDIYGNQSGSQSLKLQYDVAKNAVDLSNEAWVKNYDPLTAAECTVDGKLYGLTIYDVSSEWVINYNKSIFAKLNLKVPTTFAEFKDVCKAIAASGITPIYEPVSDGWHQVLWFPELAGAISGGSADLVTKLNANQTTFEATPLAEKALTQFLELTKLGYMGKNYMSATFADTEKSMASGKYAMTMNNLAEPTNIEKAFPDAKADNFGFFPNPILDNQYQNLNPGGPSKFIWTGSKNIDAAKQYFNYLTKTENLQKTVDGEAKFNTLPFSGLKDKFSADVKGYFAAYPKKATVLQVAVNYVNPLWVDIGKDMSAMMTGSMTPKKVLQDIDKKRADQAKAAKDPAWTK